MDELLREELREEMLNLLDDLREIAERHNADVDRKLRKLDALELQAAFPEQYDAARATLVPQNLIETIERMAT